MCLAAPSRGLEARRSLPASQCASAQTPEVLTGRSHLKVKAARLSRDSPPVNGRDEARRPGVLRLERNVDFAPRVVQFDSLVG
jgi:hypothetical protein